MQKGSGGLDVVAVASNVAAAIDSIGNIEMGGIRLNAPTPDLLNLDAMSLDVHVAMHPAAIAYYGQLKKEALRVYLEMKEDYERWRQRKWAESKAKIDDAKYKPTREDVESRLVVDFEREMVDWAKRLDAAKRSFDTLDSWFEAFRQKSFAMRDHVDINEEERFTSSGSMTRRDGEGAGGGGSRPTRDDMNTDKIRRVREIMQKRRGSAVGGSGRQG